MCVKNVLSSTGSRNFNLLLYLEFQVNLLRSSVLQNIFTYQFTKLELEYL